MVKDIDICERITRNEERIRGTQEKIRDLKNDLEKDIKDLKDSFENYKEKIDSEKKHKENMQLIKLSIIALVIISVMEFLIRVVFPS